MKQCELCNSPAKMYCDSDDASLCWDCDEKVHSANFLVAKHSRSLLCHVCQSPTPWQAAGPKLSPTVSVCLSCVRNAEKPEIGEEVRGEESDEYEDEYDNTDDDDGEYTESDDEEEDGENQVVPLSSSPSPSPVASSSGCEGVSSSRFPDGEAGYVSAFKRMREDADLDSHDEIGYSSPRFNRNRASTAIISSPASEDDETNSFTQSMVQRTIRSQGIEDRDEAESSRAVGIVNSLKRFRQTMFVGGDNQSETILEICKFTRDASVVCVNSVRSGD